MNKVILIGRLGRDPERKNTQSGKALCTFTLATDSGYGDSKKTDWHAVTCFDRQAEFVEKYLAKGALVYVEGRISYETYEKDGQKRTSTKILAQTVQALGNKNDNTTEKTDEKPDYGYQSPTNHDTFCGEPLDDGVPF